MINNYFIYVLMLEDGFYYIGLTQNINERFKQHLNGNGAEWTKLHKPKEIIEAFDTGTPDIIEARKFEDAFTRKYMKIYGWDKVRGGHWSQTSNLETFKSLKNNTFHFDNDIALINSHIKLRSYIVFVLELENDKYFIGKGFDLKKSLKDHEKGKASKWTELHKPIKLAETFPNIPESYVNSFINILTLKYMDQKGWQNVRGGSYVALNNEDLEKTIKKKKKNRA